ncbi:MAG: lytic murein transglycosylase [Proteobacteria bacterium]|nr:lytic murein transglycosylase [Pseudomonadota bacterium]
MVLRKITMVFLALALTHNASGTASAAQGGFMQWLDDFYVTVAKEGISRATWNSAFTGVIEPDPLVLEKANFQPEFTTPIWDYLDTRVNPLAVEKGRKMAKVHASTLAAVEQKFGIEQSVLLAIWSMESNYGAVLEQPERLFYVPLALATLAYGDPKRRKFARTQLAAALKILQTGEVGRAHLMGSWAGAMGHTQFIPTSYLAYGVDMDGNGRRDIWNSIPDALATAANLLKANGWQKGRPWGYEVKMPAGGEKLKEESKTLAEWAKLGFKRAGGGGFSRLEEKALLKTPAGAQGPAFLMLSNFSVIKRYNNSDSYALAVSLLADRLAGSGGLLVNAWPRPSGSLNAEEKLELQQRLQKLGLYIGEVDGHLGPATEMAIRSYQIQAGLVQDGLPSQNLLKALRR